MAAILVAPPVAALTLQDPSNFSRTRATQELIDQIEARLTLADAAIYRNDCEDFRAQSHHLDAALEQARDVVPMPLRQRWYDQLRKLRQGQCSTESASAADRRSPWDSPSEASPWDSPSETSPWDRGAEPTGFTEAAESPEARQGANRSITGTWKVFHGDIAQFVDYRFEQVGDRVTGRPIIPDHESRRFEGIRRGNSIKLSWPVNGGYECPSGNWNTIEDGVYLIVSPDGNEMNWRSRDWTYNKESCALIWHDTWTSSARPYTRVEIAAPLSIGGLQIDYSKWRAARALRQRQVKEAERAVLAAEDLHRRKLEEVMALQSRVDVAQADEEQKRRAVSAARLRLREAGSERQNDKYRALEARIARSEARMNEIMQRLAQALAEAKEALVEEHERLQRLVEQDRGSLSALENELGIAAARADAERDLAGAEAAHLVAVKSLANAISERNILANVLSGILGDYHDAVERHRQALNATSYFAEGAPLITLVRAPGYEATLWHPEKDLKLIDEGIAAARAQVRYWDDKRRSYRAQLPDRMADVDRQANALSRSQWASIAAQAGVELLYTAGDILVKFVEGGPAGPELALAEAYKKIAENLIWPPSYLDANNLAPEAHSLLDQLSAGLPETSQAADKRLKKVVLSQPVKALVLNYVKGDSAVSIRRISTEMARNSWLAFSAEDGLDAIERNLALGERLSFQRSRFDVAEEKLAKMATGTGLLKDAAKGMILGLVKDFTKNEAKQSLANLIEGEAYQDFNDAQFAFAGTALMLSRASGYYWETSDLLEGLTGLRNAIAAEYDPTNAMRISNRGELNRSEDLLIELSNRGSDPHHPSSINLHLFLGGARAQRLSGQRLIYRIPADVLQTLPEGAQELRIEVVE